MHNSTPTIIMKIMRVYSFFQSLPSLLYYHSLCIGTFLWNRYPEIVAATSRLYAGLIIISEAQASQLHHLLLPPEILHHDTPTWP